MRHLGETRHEKSDDNTEPQKASSGGRENDDGRDLRRLEKECGASRGVSPLRTNRREVEGGNAAKHGHQFNVAITAAQMPSVMK